MNKVKIFLTLTGYQITWLACVFGEKNFNQPLLGLSFGLFFIIIYFYYSINKKQLLKTILLISLPGYFFDTFMIYLSIYKFNAILNIGFLPIWMLVLWPSFAILFDEILVFFKNYKLIGILLSGLLVPVPNRASIIRAFFDSLKKPIFFVGPIKSFKALRASPL